MEEMVGRLRQKARFKLKMIVVQLKRLKRFALRVRKTAGHHPEITSSSGTSYAFGKQETLALIEQMLPDRDLFLRRFPGFILLTDNDQIGVFYLLTDRSRPQA